MERASDAFPSLSIEWATPVRGASVVQMAGELELYTVPQFQRSLQEWSPAPQGWLILDLSAIEFIDSAGISELVAVYKRFRHLKNVCLIPPRGAGGAMLGRMQITRFFVAFSSVDEALHHAAELDLADSEATGSPQSV